MKYRLIVLISIFLVMLIVGCNSQSEQSVTEEQTSPLFEEPELSIQLLPDSECAEDVEKVVQATRPLLNSPDKYWPKPQVVERDTFWWVKYALKPVVTGDGSIMLSDPGGVCIRVEKEDLSCSYEPNL